MRLTDPGGDTVSLQVCGYQFPQADDPRQRYSWHVITGEAACSRGSWRFQYPALTCDESPCVSAWLRAVADWFDDSAGGAVVATPKPLTFLEPNLSFRVAGRTPDGPVVAVDLDVEFHPTPQRRNAAGDPFTLTIAASPGALRQAATEWDQKLAAFPDGLT
jgi:hypothetical protein